MQSSHYRFQFKFILIVLFTAVFQANDDALEVGDRWELLVDEHLVERFKGKAKLRLHHPIRRELAVVHDEPGEGNGGNYHTVFEDDGIFCMYYHTWQIPVDDHPSHPLYIGYLQSRDGVH